MGQPPRRPGGLRARSPGRVRTLRPLCRAPRKRICADYRASAGIDLEHDRADSRAGRLLEMPAARACGASMAPSGAASTCSALWRERASDVTGRSLPCGHYIAEEAPPLLLHEALAFFKEGRHHEHPTHRRHRRRRHRQGSHARGHARAGGRGAAQFGIDLAFDHFDFASWDYYEKHGSMLPDDWKDQIGGHDAIFFGAVGWPEKIARPRLAVGLAAACSGASSTSTSTCGRRA